MLTLQKQAAQEEMIVLFLQAEFLPHMSEWRQPD
jgi:hypothetical protein